MVNFLFRAIGYKTKHIGRIGRIHDGACRLIVAGLTDGQMFACIVDRCFQCGHFCFISPIQPRRHLLLMLWRQTVFRLV